MQDVQLVDYRVQTNLISMPWDFVSLQSDNVASKRGKSQACLNFVELMEQRAQSQVYLNYVESWQKSMTIKREQLRRLLNIS